MFAVSGEGAWEFFFEGHNSAYSSLILPPWWWVVNNRQTLTFSLLYGTCPVTCRL